LAVLLLFSQPVETPVVPDLDVIVILFHRVEKKKRDPDSIQSQKDESSKKKSKPPSVGPKLDVVK